MASGVAVHDDVVNAFSDLKMKKLDGCPWIVLKIENDKEIVVDLQGKSGQTYEEMVDYLKEKAAGGECRYAIVDIEVDVKSGAKTNKLGLISWCPDGAKIKQKMIYTSSAEALKKKLGGGYKFHQANDDDELCKSEVVATLCKH